MLLIRSDFVCCEVLIALSLGGVFYKAWLSVCRFDERFVYTRGAAHPRLAATTGDGGGRWSSVYGNGGIGLLWVFCGRVAF